jgi:hypothetical protein
MGMIRRKHMYNTSIYLWERMNSAINPLTVIGLLSFIDISYNIIIFYDGPSFGVGLATSSNLDK